MINSLQKRIKVENTDFTRELFGNFDENIKLIQKLLGVDVVLREDEIVIIGSDQKVDVAEKLVSELLSLYQKGEGLTSQNISYTASLLLEGKSEGVQELAGDVVFVTDKGKPIKPKTLGQKKIPRKD